MNDLHNLVTLMGAIIHRGLQLEKILQLGLKQIFSMFGCLDVWMFGCLDVLLNFFTFDKVLF